jgi:hypothetical protein
MTDVRKLSRIVTEKESYAVSDSLLIMSREPNSVVRPKATSAHSSENVSVKV